MTRNPRMAASLVAATIAVTFAVVGCPAAMASAKPVATTGADATALATRISAENATLLPALHARGGTLSTDGRFVRMPDGVEVSVAPTALTDCPSGWVCLWSDASYSGRLVRWNAAGTRVNLADLSFDNQMTSWANRGPYDARWFYNANYSGTTRCMNAGTSTSNVGSTDNDQASSLAIYTDSVACS